MNAECGMRNAECGMRIADCKRTKTLFIPHSAFRIPLSVAQTDDDPDRVPEVIQPFTSGPGSQVIYLTEANGEIVMHFDIDPTSQGVCERIARI